MAGPELDGASGGRSTRGSVSNENNILLDPDVLTKYPTQALLLTVLVRTSTSAFMSSNVLHVDRISVVQ